MKELLLMSAIIGIVLISGCVTFPKAEPEKVADNTTAINACVTECNKWLKSYLMDGPCLSNKIVDGWVCDVAHSPREAVDDLLENQCSAYREGTIKHFVEVNVSCALIRAQ